MLISIGLLELYFSISSAARLFNPTVNQNFGIWQNGGDDLGQKVQAN